MKLTKDGGDKSGRIPAGPNRRELLQAFTTVSLGPAGLTLLQPTEDEASDSLASTQGKSFCRPRTSILDVRDYGARGNGVSDDTSAFQITLDRAASLGGAIVFAPTGNYSIDGNLVIPANVTLMGVWRAPTKTAAGTQVGTTLLARSGRNDLDGQPFITLGGSNATVEGLNVYWPEQNDFTDIRPYPWAIRAGAEGTFHDNCSVINVNLVNPYNGVDFGTFGAGRHLIRGLYGQPLNRGIVVDRCFDIGRMTDIHFWPFWSGDNPEVLAYTRDHTIAIALRHVDGEFMSNIFAIHCLAGLELEISEAPDGGAAYAAISNIGFDVCRFGIFVKDTPPFGVIVSNCQIASAVDGVGIQGAPGDAKLNVLGGTFWGGGRPIVWENSGLISVSDCHFVEWDPAHPAVSVVEGSAMIRSNVFFETSPPGRSVQIESSAKRAVVTNNDFMRNKNKISVVRRLVANNLL